MATMRWWISSRNTLLLLKPKKKKKKKKLKPGPRDKEIYAHDHCLKYGDHEVVDLLKKCGVAITEKRREDEEEEEEAMRNA